MERSKKVPGPIPVPSIKAKSNLRKELHTLLADDIAVAIFRESLSGFVARQSTIDRMGLTKKQYHPRVAKLVELGLVAKLKGTSDLRQSSKPNVTTYMATPLGRMIYRWQVKLCDEIALNPAQIGLLFDLLNRHPGTLSETQVIDLAKSLFVDADVLYELFRHPESKWDLGLLEDEKTMIYATCDLVAHATTRVQAVAPSLPDAVVKDMSTLASNGTPVFAIVKDAETLQTSDSQTNVQQQPANMTYPGSPLAIKFRKASVDHYFVTVDDHFIIIQQVNPLDRSFLYGLKIRSDRLAVKYGSIFQGLWFAAQDLSAAGRCTTEQQPAAHST